MSVRKRKLKAPEQSRFVKCQLGQIYGRNTLFMCFAAGEAKSEDGHEYDLSYTPGGTPIVRSEQSGRSWTISWRELIDLAIKGGVDEPEKPT